MRTAAAILLGLACMAHPAQAAAAAELPGRTIPGAGAWRLIEPPDPAGCSARLQAGAGSDVDTMLLVNNAGKLVLVAGRGDWNLGPGAPKVTIRIDDLPPRTVQASMAVNLVLVLADNDAFYRQLRHARSLAWTLPMGRFGADVTGLGAAFDAAVACKKSHPTPAG